MIVCTQIIFDIRILILDDSPFKSRLESLTVNVGILHQLNENTRTTKVVSRVYACCFSTPSARSGLFLLQVPIVPSKAVPQFPIIWDKR
jgi:hypothetical protein